jgi:hypothetical protein
MDVSCPSLPPKILVPNETDANKQTTACMAAHGCHFVVCSLYVLLVNIECFPRGAQLSHHATLLV